MASINHWFVVDLFRDAPELLPHLLQAGLHLDLPPFATAAVQESDFTQVVSVEYRADLVVTLYDKNAKAVIALVLEVQRRIDQNKRYSWPLYWAALHARMRCRTLLVVLTLDAKMAKWARKPIRTLIPTMTPCTVIGPLEIPRIKGEAKGEAKALLLVLAARGVPVSEEARQRVLECSDLALLGRWIELATSAATVEEILGDS